MHFDFNMFICFFFYIGKNKFNSISQMLSQNHTANHINFWLTDWKIRNQNADEVIVDSSEALMSACVNTFAGCKSVNAYNTECFDSLLNNTKPPASFIRCDRSHFVKSITSNKSLKQVSTQIRRLFLGIIGYVIQCEKVDECATILRHIFTLTKNEYVNGDVISAQSFLQKLVATHNFANEDSKPDDRVTDPECQIDIFCDNENLSGSDTYKDTSTYQWIMNIHSSVEVNNQSEEDSIYNVYFCGKAENFVFKLFTRLPMWSNIMCEKFKSDNFTPTSSASESEFKNVKRLMGIKTRKIPVFVNLHLEQLFGGTKLALANLNGADAVAESKNDPVKHKMKRRIRSGSIDSFPSTSSLQINQSHSPLDGNFESPNRSRSENDLSLTNEPCENWKGRNKDPPLVRRSKVSILNPHDVNYFSRNVPLLRNGYTKNSRSRNGKSEIVTETCGMDSLFAIYCTAYLDNEAVKNEIDGSTSENEFSYFIKTFFTGKKKTKFIYCMRTELLRKIFTKELYSKQIKEDDHTIVIRCNTGIAGLLEKLVQLDKGLISSVERKRECILCNYENTEFLYAVPLRVSINSEVNLTNIERYISTEILFTCRECGSRSAISENFKNVIAFEVEPFVNKRGKKYKISQLKQEICVNGSNYTLFALVENDPIIRHFIPHVKRTDGIWQTIDDLKTEIFCSPRITSTPMFIFMLFYIKQT